MHFVYLMKLLIETVLRLYMSIIPSTLARNFFYNIRNFHFDKTFYMKYLYCSAQINWTLRKKTYLKNSIFCMCQGQSYKSTRVYMRVYKNIIVAYGSCRFIFYSNSTQSTFTICPAFATNYHKYYNIYMCEWKRVYAAFGLI